VNIPIRWAVIPVAGKGRRMEPLSRAVPKELLPLGRKPLLQRVIEELVGAGIRDLVFVTSPEKPSIRDFLSDRAFWRPQLKPWTDDEIRFHLVEQLEPRGLGHAILQARPEIGEQSFVVALGDCLIESPHRESLVQRMMAQAKQPDVGAVIALEEVPSADVSKFGIAAIEPGNTAMRITDLVEKPEPSIAPSRWAIAGRYILAPAVFERLGRTDPGHGGEIQLTDAIRRLLKEYATVWGVPLTAGERRLDAGDFPSYFRSSALFASRAIAGMREPHDAHSGSHQVCVGRAFARAGLLGNPSDGYGGKTLSCIVGNWSAEVRLSPSDRLCFVRGSGEPESYDSIEAFRLAVQRHGYYGGLRLLQAATNRFYDHCQSKLKLKWREAFCAEYHSDIPRQLGLGGSSAIVVAALRALSAFYEIDIPRQWLPGLALSVETNELGIPAGLQDRVIQSYEGLMFMDFSPEHAVTEHGLNRGAYERMDHRLLPRLYVAIRESSAEPTEVLHGDLRQRFERGDTAVVEAMRDFAGLAERGRQSLLEGDHDQFSELMDANFDLRRSICRILPEHLELIEVARRAGASAKFCGSGGAIVGVCPEGSAWDALQSELASIGARAVRPRIDVWH
jgi:glucuronokinase